ncbi:hypothetical protein AURDEDRAFT_159659 [Auricularia subglabra TFB-10046 SS5]|nr:hypothetical protein AURDEDRAFT_159659 [Auricularia subglabra TFB-10046 SS5]
MSTESKSTPANINGDIKGYTKYIAAFPEKEVERLQEVTYVTLKRASVAHRVRQIYKKSKGVAVGLKPDQRVLERRWSRDRTLYDCLTWLLPGLQFGQASRIRRKLSHFLYDETLYLDQWVVFLRDSIAPELTAVALNGSALLAADLAFLSLSGINDATHGLPLACKFLVITSAFMSTGAVCLAALVLAIYRRIKEMHSHELESFIKGRRFGLHSLPVLFSMPSSTIIWAMLDFLVAVLGSGLQDWGHIIGVPFIAITVATLAVHFVWVFSFRSALRRSLRAHVSAAEGGRGEGRLSWVFSLPDVPQSPDKETPPAQSSRFWNCFKAREGRRAAGEA